MFSNSIKRLSESLAQAQEQARQQRQRAQQRHGDSKPLFDADNEEASFVNGDEPDTKQSTEETRKPPEEPKTTSSMPDAKDPSLPKEVRIKLAKLAKYEDRHPSDPFITIALICLELQAAYKETQAKIATFEKVLKERTPLGSIDQVEDFANFLSNLSMRTNVSKIYKFNLTVDIS
jgi:hypothetical protein